ncbi:LuxR C-terminal-related transcriptional regulator [Nocardioides sp. TF02-7]|uniref:LuxR C-terminal-related transcriptional regulator n=1 Tax=Nocardioides sp. TF02-7 TaxID=2917724 RepID=UPI001F05FD4C|nr:LuxR C-terminal-related transcriptional regulator [Nocardioides sp. TF02-7]UMG92747.1 LuxR C-terminal-related transcriptional regulator [Nocardioides sp. TF02-7]
MAATDEDDTLRAAREAFDRRDWSTARENFRAAGELAPTDLADLASACWWLGLAEENVLLNIELHRRALTAGDVTGAALAALLIGYCEGIRGREDADSWLARARRLFDDVPEAPERGYLLTVDLELAIAAGDVRAEQLARRVLELGNRHGDATLEAHGLFGLGALAVRAGRIAEGRRWLDEAMIPVRAGLVRPEWSGNLYCRMIQLCHELADLPRAQHWTALTEEWCRDHAPAVIFTGICRVHRVQLWEVRGEWTRAEEEAERAAADLVDLDVAVAAEAHYRLGELHRLRGALEPAEEAYRRAHELGRDPLPGLALLHLTRGHVRVAASILRAALAAERTPLRRAPLLVALAEVAMAGRDVDCAASCADELERVADQHASPGWRAAALTWRGVVLGAQGRHGQALAVLREARSRWQAMDAPYDVARVRLEIAEGCDALGDHDTAELERDEAERLLARLDARTDLERLRARRPRRRPHELSPREREVVALVATGASNRAVGERLGISERTVARHLANVYLKTGTSSRTGAVAWARARGVV